MIQKAQAKKEFCIYSKKCIGGIRQVLTLKGFYLPGVTLHELKNIMRKEFA